MPRPKPTKYNAQQEKFVRMEARAESRADIMREVFGIDIATADKHVIAAADAKMCRWRKFPCYLDTWKDEVQRVCISATSEALKKIRAQIRDDNGWLANKAANDNLNFAKPLIWGEDDKALTVKIEGMPELGTPDGDV